MLCTPLLVAASEQNSINPSSQLEEMKQFDMVITEPWAINEVQIRELQEAGVIVLGYIPTTSIDIAHPPFTGLEDNDYVWIHKHKVINYNDISPDWIMDSSNPHYRQIVVNTIKETIYDRGFDGVFLDTLNQAPEYLSCYVSLDPVSMDELTRLFLNGSMELCKEIRALDKTKIVVQNNGWRELVNFTAPYIDGLMWENYPYELGESDYWLNQKRKNLIALSNKYHFKILTSSFINQDDYNKVKDFYSISRSYGFIPYAAWTSGELIYDNINTYDVPPRSKAPFPGVDKKHEWKLQSFLVDLSGPDN